jgi:hypothetical protein
VDHDDDADEVVIEITIEVPGEATRVEVLRFAEEVVTHADDIHRALGGHGLKVVDHAGDLTEPEDGGGQ